MAEVKVKVCDSCGSTIPKDQEHRVRTVITGPMVEGEWSEDRCPNCISLPEGVELRPKRTRQPAQTGHDATPSEAASDGQGGQALTDLSDKTPAAAASTS